MNRNVTLKISGLHMESEQDDGSENGKIQTTATAEYFYRGEAHYVLYEESQEDSGGCVKNRIKYKNRVLELTRKGLIDTHMVFEEGKRHETCYNMPYGQLSMAIHTKKLIFEETEKCIHIAVEYALEINGQHQSDSHIEILVEAKK